MFGKKLLRRRSMSQREMNKRSAEPKWRLGQRKHMWMAAGLISTASPAVLATQQGSNWKVKVSGEWETGRCCWIGHHGKQDRQARNSVRGSWKTRGTESSGGCRKSRPQPRWVRGRGKEETAGKKIFIESNGINKQTRFTNRKAFERNGEKIGNYLKLGRT